MMSASHSLSAPAEIQPRDNSEPRAVRVAIVEDEPGTRTRFGEAVSSTPGLQLIAAFSSGQAMCEWLEYSRPDVLLVDLGLPDMSGIAVIKRCKSLNPACDAMVISMFGDEQNVIRSIEAGATGYILKDSLPDEIGALVKQLRAGGAPMSPLIARKVLERFRAAPAPAAPPMGMASPGPLLEGLPNILSDREKEILELVARGFSTMEAGELLNISVNTVRSHIKRCYEKLEVHSKNEAVYEATRMGWIRP
jgi:DNA-binding NarL/FixJ family response regulator